MDPKQNNPQQQSGGAGATPGPRAAATPAASRGDTPASRPPWYSKAFARPAEPPTSGPVVPPRAPEPPKAPEEYRFEIRTPNPGFRGNRFGVNFNDGVGYTDNPSLTRACAECGYAFLDRKTEESWWPEKGPLPRYLRDDATADAQR